MAMHIDKRTCSKCKALGATEPQLLCIHCANHVYKYNPDGSLTRKWLDDQNRERSVRQNYDDGLTEKQDQIAFEMDSET